MKINEIFYSLQGEGAFTGTPSVFIRLAGCNLKCPFCDTEHNPFIEMSEAKILDEIFKYPAKHIVITGGEPLLQLTCSFVERLRILNFFVQIETNGTKDKDVNADWVTCSPKFEFCPNAKLALKKINELKVVYSGQDMSIYDGIEADVYYLQPCDTKNKKTNKQNLSKAISFIKKNPKWKLSLQTQKILNVR